MRYFGFVDSVTGEYLEIQIRVSDKLSPAKGLWCGNKVIVSHDLYRSFPAGDNAAVRKWFANLQQVDPMLFVQLELES